MDTEYYSNPKCLRWMKKNPGLLEGFMDGFLFLPLTAMVLICDAYHTFTFRKEGARIGGWIGFAVGAILFAAFIIFLGFIGVTA